MSRYPPLNALVVFDVAMRTGSFSRAASELHVTPGAVGQQIQKLESLLGVSLFVRRTRQIEPTPDAIRYWQRIQPALAQVSAASESLTRSRGNGVWLSMPPTFAAKWFTRHMADFLTRHPEIALHLDSSATMVDFASEQVDLAIRYFSGDDPELDATLLCADDARVSAGPEYARRQLIEKPADIARCTLLCTAYHPYWGEWLLHYGGVPLEQQKGIPAVHFDQALLAIEAARQGQGVVMTSPLGTEEEIALGTLVELFPYRLPLATGYYVVHPKRTPLRPPAEACKTWLCKLFSR